MADEDRAIAEAAVDLNEGAKAARRTRKPGNITEALEASREHFAGKPEEERADLSEAAHDNAIGRMEAMATDAVLDDKALVWDVRDFLLDQIKSRPKPWSATSNGEQRDVAAACEHAGKELVRKIVETIAANGREPVRVLLTKVTLGDDIVIACKLKTMGADEEERAVALLHHARGKHVLLTPASADDYSDNQRGPDVDEDQRALGFEAGSDAAPDGEDE
jgi:predicted small metal-binding protein